MKKTILMLLLLFLSSAKALEAGTKHKIDVGNHTKYEYDITLKTDQGEIETKRVHPYGGIYFKFYGKVILVIRESIYGDLCIKYDQTCWNPGWWRKYEPAKPMKLRGGKIDMTIGKDTIYTNKKGTKTYKLTKK